MVILHGFQFLSLSIFFFYNPVYRQIFNEINYLVISLFKTTHLAAVKIFENLLIFNLTIFYSNFIEQIKIKVTSTNKKWTITYLLCIRLLLICKYSLLTFYITSEQVSPLILSTFNSISLLLHN